MENLEELTSKLKELIKKIQGDKQTEDKIMKFLITNHNIPTGQVVDMLDNPEEMWSYVENEKEIILFIKQLQYYTGDESIMLEDYFSRADIKEYKYYDASLFKADLSLPVTFEESSILTSESYDTIMDIKTIKELFESGVLTYDFEIQREYSTIKDSKGNLRKVPTIYKKNVDEICNYLLKGKLKPSTIILNAHKGSADGGKEIAFDHKTGKMEIQKGTTLAILDGFHRINGIFKALMMNPNLELRMRVTIANYSKIDAKDYQYQISKATPISKHRQIQLSLKSPVIDVIKKLEEPTSDMNGKILVKSQGEDIMKYFIRYSDLFHEIEANFIVRTYREATSVGDYLTKFFNEVINAYIDDFMGNLILSRRRSLVTRPRIFATYVGLAAEMRNRNIEPERVTEVFSQIDFNRKNPLWEEMKIIEPDGSMTTKLKPIDDFKKYLIGLLNNLK